MPRERVSMKHAARILGMSINELRKYMQENPIQNGIGYARKTGVGYVYTIYLSELCEYLVKTKKGSTVKLQERRVIC